MKTKDTEIQALKKRLNILGIHDVQTLKLQVIQKEKEQILKQMMQMGYQIEMYEKHIEILKKGTSSSQTTKSLDTTHGLSKELADFNLKGDKIEKVKKKISTQNEDIKYKDNIIGEYYKLKAKMKIDIKKL